jgi:hypothetical protein
MIIRNKFNGYGRDGIRLYFDPATIVAIGSAGMTAPAVAAPVVAGAGTGLAAAGTAAAQTAALEATKQAVIQEGMKQAGLEATKQVGLEAGKQAAAEAAKQAAVEAGKQAAQQGIAQGAQNMTLEQQLAQIQANPTDLSKFPQFEQLAGKTQLAEKGLAQGASGTPPYPTANMPVNPPAPASPAPVATTPPPAGNIPPLGSQSSAVPPEILNTPAAPTPTPVEAAARESMRRSAERGFQEYTAREAAANMSPLEKGFQTALKFAKDKPEYVGMGLMSLGQYMNKPEEEDKDKYKSTVDMSEFKASTPSVAPFKPSYEYQKYAIGGPVETMAAQNAVGANTGYPMAGINTAMYSNPMVQRPEAVNVISPSGDAGVSAYSGEPKFAEGGISEEMAREYGLKTRKQRATRSLTKDYEEAQAERDKEATALLSERSGSGIIPRSRTQMLSSPFSAAIEEHNRLAKKTRTPKYEPAKTSLGDIDTYMDIPVEAARGGIMGNLGSYSDGGRLLRGPGDGVSDSIPAVIGKRQPARLADGEFVIPARIVSELGNGSTEAGARKLYAMMERIQNTRKKSIGKKKVAVNSRADKHLPA